MASNPDISAGDHKAYMEYALSLATKSPPAPTNYRVGAVLVDRTCNAVVSTGYTLERPGNTHAEQCCFLKAAEARSVSEEQLAAAVDGMELILYTTMEPCSRRLSGNLPCVERILGLKKAIKTVYVGVMEPEIFVRENSGRKALVGAGIEFVHVEGLEDEILKVAKAGHEKG